MVVLLNNLLYGLSSVFTFLSVIVVSILYKLREWNNNTVQVHMLKFFNLMAFLKITVGFPIHLYLKFHGKLFKYSILHQLQLTTNTFIFNKKRMSTKEFQVLGA